MKVNECGANWMSHCDGIIALNQLHTVKAIPERIMRIKFGKIPTELSWVILRGRERDDKTIRIF